MRTFKHFNSDFAAVCPVCQTSKDCETVLVPIPGTNAGPVCEAVQVHRKCFDLLEEMRVTDEEEKAVLF